MADTLVGNLMECSPPESVRHVDEQERLTVAALGYSISAPAITAVLAVSRFARTADLHYSILDSMHALHQAEPWRR